jgi:hypothetical protein
MSKVSVKLFPLVISAVKENIANSVEQVRSNAIRAAIHASVVIDAFDELIAALGGAGDQYTLCLISRELFQSTAEMKKKPIFNDWIRLLCKLAPNSKEGIDNYDYLLSQLISEKEHQQFVIVCLTEWASNNVIDSPRDKSIAALFNSTTRELANRSTLLSQVITDWFLSDNRRHASAAAGLLSDLWVHGLRDPSFDTSRLDALQPSELLFLARRMIGFIYSEDHLIRLTLSLLKTNRAPQRTFDLVYSLLINELGRDFPSATVVTLTKERNITIDTDLVAFYSNALDALNTRNAALNALPRLVELRPPTRLQFQFGRARAKQMRIANEEASKGSIFRQLSTEIKLKAGIAAFSYRDGHYSDSIRLQTISNSISMPLRSVYDTVGYELNHFILRTVKRDDP